MTSLTSAEGLTDDDHHRCPVTIEIFAPDPTSPTFEKDVLPLARCYQYVYGADSSWNEGRKCPRCSTAKAPKKWNLQGAPDTCDACDEPTEEFWPLESIIADMRDEFARPDAVCVVAIVEGVLVGGAWGFSASAEEMERHLNHGLPEEARVKKIREALEGLFPGQRVAYQDEIFVHPDMQKLGIGGRLFRARHQRFVKHGLVGYVLRTKTNPPSQSYLWYSSPRWGYSVIGRYPDIDKRVVLATSFQTLLAKGRVRA